MRWVGMVLVLLGALGLGWRGFAQATGVAADTAPVLGRDVEVPPIASGIAVVSGLLFMASAGRRGES